MPKVSGLLMGILSIIAGILVIWMPGLLAWNRRVWEMSKEKPLLILFDGNALVHRAFHALPPLTITKTGEMVNAVQGFASTLLKLLRENKPDYWAIAFDRRAPTFRHEMFEDYKAQRPKTPPELVTQIERVHQLAEAFNLPIFEMDGYEADDIIGTLSTAGCCKRHRHADCDGRQRYAAGGIAGYKSHVAQARLCRYRDLR